MGYPDENNETIPKLEIKNKSMVFIERNIMKILVINNDIFVEIDIESFTKRMNWHLGARKIKKKVTYAKI